jgi:hypothetical protein
MPGAQRIVNVGPATFETIARAIESRGLVRDPDRSSVEYDRSGRPSLASWSSAGGDDREVDFRCGAESSIAWLEVRGEGAADLAGALAADLGGREMGGSEELLAGLMTPRHPGWRADRIERGSSRWHRLQAALAVYGEANAVLVRSLIRAGLLDPDWRVRMTAMLAVGRLRLSDLAPLASKARVPQAGRGGVGQEDRRMLLALRQACHDFALGLPPSAGPGDGTDAAIAALRREFQAKLHRLLGGEDIDDLPARAIFRNLTGESSLEAGRRRR